MEDKDQRDALVRQLRWIMGSCTTLSVAVQDENPDVNLADLSDMLDKVMAPFSDFMSACFGEGDDSVS